MQTKVANQSAAERICSVRWSSWIVPFFIRALLLAALVGVAFHVVRASWDLPRLLFWLGLGFVAAVIVGVKVGCHPIRGRSDASHLWNEQFPTHMQEEIPRFIRIVGKSFGFGARHWSKVRPDDGLSAIHHQWSGGDGKEVVELVMHVEREYSLELPGEFLTTEKTLGELFAYVTRPATGRSTLAGAGPSQPSQSLS
jgi:hypothetical protein